VNDFIESLNIYFFFVYRNAVSFVGHPTYNRSEAVNQFLYQILYILFSFVKTIIKTKGPVMNKKVTNRFRNCRRKSCKQVLLYLRNLFFNKMGIFPRLKVNKLTKSDKEISQGWCFQLDELNVWLFIEQSLLNFLNFNHALTRTIGPEKLPLLSLWSVLGIWIRIRIRIH
jgi:hypothetical protein